MQRYQVYFEPSTMETLLELSYMSGVSRSHLLQELADILATRYKSFVKQETHAMGNILELSGIISGRKAMSHTAVKPDNEYFGI